MKKGLLAILTAATLAVGGGVFVASGTAFGYIICNGTFDTQTITTSVVVPKGAFCNLQTTIVEGNVQVQSGGTLVVGAGSTIEGSVQSNAPGSNPGDPVANGVSPFSIVICNSDIDGPVQISGATAAVEVGANTSPGCGGNDINENGTNSSTGVSLTSNKGPTYLDSNAITGSVGVSSNRGLTDVSDNTISANLTCSANNPAPVGGGNTVGGSKNLQCSSL